jgi:hypothetical protein
MVPKQRHWGGGTQLVTGLQPQTSPELQLRAHQQACSCAGGLLQDRASWFVGLQLSPQQGGWENEWEQA